MALPPGLRAAVLVAACVAASPARAEVVVGSFYPEVAFFDSPVHEVASNQPAPMLCTTPGPRHPCLPSYAVGGVEVEGSLMVGTFVGAEDTRIVVSRDGGATTRRWMGKLPGRLERVVLSKGRVFLMIGGAETPLVYGARVFELDLDRGTLTRRGGTGLVADAQGFVDFQGRLHSVGHRSTGGLVVTTFDPGRDAIDSHELACTVAGCEPSGYVTDRPARAGERGRAFVTSDGETFRFVTRLVRGGGQCVVTVGRSARTVTSACRPAEQAVTVAPGVWVGRALLRDSTRLTTELGSQRVTVTLPATIPTPKWLRAEASGEPQARTPLTLGRDACLPTDNGSPQGAPCANVITYVTLLDAKRAVIVIRNQQHGSNARRPGITTYWERWMVAEVSVTTAVVNELY